MTTHICPPVGAEREPLWSMPITTGFPASRLLSISAKDRLVIVNKKDNHFDNAITTLKLEFPNSVGVGRSSEWVQTYNWKNTYYVDLRVIIDGEAYVTRYAHMVEGSLTVVKGEKVKAGTRLGIMGNTGASAGRHLHFEICKGRVHRWTSDGKGFVDPLKFVKATIAKWELNAEVNLATPDTGEVLPAPVHEPEPKAPKPQKVKLKLAK